MQLLPTEKRSDAKSEEKNQPSRTYGLDVAGMRIRGEVDGQEAMAQAIFKRLQSWWGAHIIYNAHYGFEAQGLIGKDDAFIRSELKRRIREALFEDGRIHSIEDFAIAPGEDGDAWEASFRVRTCFGDVRIREEVKIG